MPSMVQQQENTAEQSDVRRKKQATKRMEQLIKLHGADEPGLLDDIVPEAGEDHHRLSVNSSSVRKHVTIFNKLLINSLHDITEHTSLHASATCLQNYKLSFIYLNVEC